MERMVDHRLLESAVGVVMISYIVILQRVVELMGWPDYRVRSLHGMTHRVLSESPR